MMSNCAFWSASGELLAVHGVGPTDPLATFGPWAAARRLPSGRIVGLSPGFPLPETEVAGWQLVAPGFSLRPRKLARTPKTDVAVATPQPALDEVSSRVLPLRIEHPKFSLKAWPTWTTTVHLLLGEGTDGWYAALNGPAKSNQFLVRLVPHNGRLPGPGWRNMLAWSLHQHAGVRLVPLNGLPTAQALAAAPAWEYRVEAGQGVESAAWDVQVLPARRLLEEWAPGAADPWQATAWLRWVRPGAAGAASLPGPEGEFLWAELLARLPVGDARLLVQNVLTTLPGGVASAAVLFYDTVTLSDPDGRTLVRYVPLEGLPVALLSTLFGHRAWRELERAKRLLPGAEESRQRRAEAAADLDLRLAEGRLPWSDEALNLWQVLYRTPQHQRQEAELKAWRGEERWSALFSGDRLVIEAVLRDLDVTDVALCLRDAPDQRWRRFVTARREAEIREELDFCRAWDARGELTVERQLDAWQTWDKKVRSVRANDEA